VTVVTRRARRWRPGRCPDQQFRGSSRQVLAWQSCV